MNPELELTLYSGPLSLFTAKVRIALAEKGLDYERVEVGWSLADRYEPHHPEVVALNPNRQVPVQCRQLEQAADEILFPAVWDLIDEVFYPKPESERASGRQ